MNPRHREPIRGGGGRGFSLTELLVVIGIIALLATLAVPVAMGLRKRAWATDSAAQINMLRAAIDNYYATFRAYPGPLSDAQIARVQGAGPLPPGIGGGQVTGTENLVLGMMGGLKRDSGGQVAYDPAAVGQGAYSLNPTNPKRYPVFVEGVANQLSPGKFTEADTGRQPASDSNIPEFLDRYPLDPMPVLFLRARVGAPGIVNAGSSKKANYDLADILPYTQADINLKQHGLREQGAYGDGKVKRGPNGALVYLSNPRIPPQNASNDQLANFTGTPRQKDSYILISAGPDRIYGTFDDITNFGSVGE